MAAVPKEGARTPGDEADATRADEIDRGAPIDDRADDWARRAAT